MKLIDEASQGIGLRDHQDAAPVAVFNRSAKVVEIASVAGQLPFSLDARYSFCPGFILPPFLEIEASSDASAGSFAASPRKIAA